jgi:hypothetical protein
LIFFLPDVLILVLTAVTENHTPIVKTFVIPNVYAIGEAAGEGDYFFDLLAQGSVLVIYSWWTI